MSGKGLTSPRSRTPQPRAGPALTPPRPTARTLGRARPRTPPPPRLPLTSTRTGPAPPGAAPHTVTSPKTPARPAERERPNHRASRPPSCVRVREAAPRRVGEGSWAHAGRGRVRDSGTAEVIGKANRIVNSSKNNRAGRDPQGAPPGTGAWMGAPLGAELGRGALSPAEPDASVACRLSPQNRLTRGLMGVMLTLAVLCGVRSRVPSSQPYLCVAAVRENALFKGCRLISSDSCLCLRSHRHSPDSEHIRRPHPLCPASPPPRRPQASAGLLASGPRGVRLLGPGLSGVVLGTPFVLFPLE